MKKRSQRTRKPPFSEVVEDAEPRSAGRPSEDISETRFELRLPVDLVQAMKRLAAEQEISSSEAWRRAARAFLGLENALPEDA